MNILFVDEKSWVKKVPYTIHYLAEGLQARGHQVFAVDFDDTWTKENMYDLWSRAQRHSVWKLDPAAPVDVTTPGFVKLPGLSRISTLATHTAAIAKLLKHERIDCIVTYAISNALPTLALAKLLGVPVAFHSIDMLAPLVPHPLLARPAEWFEQVLMRGADCTLALTPIFAERARQRGARRTALIPNGVNTARLRPDIDTSALRAELGLRDEKVILFVGTLTPHVGMEPFLRHFARISHAGIKFVIVGDDIVTAGRERVKAEALCRELGITDHVIFTGLQPAVRVPAFINLADVCVSPFPPAAFSRYNIAMKVFEYMACARPTVTFRLEGTQSLVPPGAGGVVYVETHEEMMAAIAQLLVDDSARAHLGATGRRLVEQRFSWDHVVANLERVLVDLVSTKRGRRAHEYTHSVSEQ